jgi:hypothetical protein
MIFEVPQRAARQLAEGPPVPFVTEQPAEHQEFPT